MNDVQIADCRLQLVDDDRGFVHQPDFASFVCLGSREQLDGGVDGVLLLTKVEDVAVGLVAVEDSIGSRERLNQPVVLEVLVDVQRVEVFGVESRE